MVQTPCPVLLLRELWTRGTVTTQPQQRPTHGIATHLAHLQSLSREAKMSTIFVYKLWFLHPPPTKGPKGETNQQKQKKILETDTEEGPHL